jgi:D-amino-acid dehydrogenase
VTATYDAAVVGGGLLGLATAYHLVRAGLSTMLVDRADAGRATAAGAGILSPETNSRDPDAWFRSAWTRWITIPRLSRSVPRDRHGPTGPPKED